MCAHLHLLHLPPPPLLLACLLACVALCERDRELNAAAAASFLCAQCHLRRYDLRAVSVQLFARSMAAGVCGARHCCFCCFNSLCVAVAGLRVCVCLRASVRLAARFMALRAHANECARAACCAMCARAHQVSSTRYERKPLARTTLLLLLLLLSLFM